MPTPELESLDEAQIERAIGLRGRMVDFVQSAWPMVETSPYVSGWHIDAVCDHLEAVQSGQIRDLVINIPPGMSKTLLTSVFFNAWTWIREPATRILVSSYSHDLSRNAGVQVRTLCSSAWWRERFLDRCTVSPKEAGDFFHTSAGGWRLSTSVEGVTTGKHADIVIVDDPIKPQEVTKKGLENVILWWKETMSTRFRDPKTGRKVIIMQRLSDLDLAGYCIEQGFDLLRLPMRYEAKNPCYTKIGGDLRTVEGELLCPERFDIEAVERVEKSLGSMATASQYQQRPVPEGGAIFKAEWFKTYATLPERFDTQILSWDMAFKGTDTSDYVVGQVWGRIGSDYYLIDQVRGRWDFPRSVKEVEALAKLHPKAVAKLIEDKANGPAVIQTLEKRISGIVAMNPDGGKEARANAVAPLIEAGNVYLPLNAPWREAFVTEFSAFPNGANDDQVDSASQALTYMYGKATRLREAMMKLKGRL